MDNCFEKIKNTIKKRSKACSVYDENQLFNIYNSKEKNKCQQAIEKYKKRLLICCAEMSFRQRRKKNYLSNLYKINQIFKNNYEE